MRKDNFLISRHLSFHIDSVSMRNDGRFLVFNGEFSCFCKIFQKPLLYLILLLMFEKYIKYMISAENNTQNNFHTNPKEGISRPKITIFFFLCVSHLTFFLTQAAFGVLDHSGPMRGALVFEVPGSIPGRGNCVVSLSKTLSPYCFSPPRCNEYLRG